jgi:hypothetical protein
LESEKEIGDDIMADPREIGKMGIKKGDKKQSKKYFGKN